jgi:hypothetical protein
VPEEVGYWGMIMKEIQTTKRSYASADSALLQYHHDAHVAEQDPEPDDPVSQD